MADTRHNKASLEGQHFLGGDGYAVSAPNRIVVDPNCYSHSPFARLSNVDSRAWCRSPEPHDQLSVDIRDLPPRNLGHSSTTHALGHSTAADNARVDVPDIVITDTSSVESPQNGRYGQQHDRSLSTAPDTARHLLYPSMDHNGNPDVSGQGHHRPQSHDRSVVDTAAAPQYVFETMETSSGLPSGTESVTRSGATDNSSYGYSFEQGMSVDVDDIFGQGCSVLWDPALQATERPHYTNGMSEAMISSSTCETRTSATSRGSRIEDENSIDSPLRLSIPSPTVGPLLVNDSPLQSHHPFAVNGDPFAQYNIDAPESFTPDPSATTYSEWTTPTGQAVPGQPWHAHEDSHTRALGFGGGPVRRVNSERSRRRPTYERHNRSLSVGEQQGSALWAQDGQSFVGYTTLSSTDTTSSSPSSDPLHGSMYSWGDSPTRSISPLSYNTSELHFGGSLSSDGSLSPLSLHRPSPYASPMLGTAGLSRASMGWLPEGPAPSGFVDNSEPAPSRGGTSPAWDELAMDDLSLGGVKQEPWSSPAFPASASLPLGIDSGRFTPARPKAVVTTQAVSIASRERRKRPHRFNCAVPGCMSTFTTKVNYEGHMSSHSGERKFSCGDCGRAFIRLSDMRRHAKVHGGRAKFACTECKKVFTRKDTLTAHRRNHAA